MGDLSRSHENARIDGEVRKQGLVTRENVVRETQECPYLRNDENADENKIIRGVLRVVRTRGFTQIFLGSGETANRERARMRAFKENARMRERCECGYRI